MQLLVLTKSEKHNGFCVAGLPIQKYRMRNGRLNWIRLIGNNEHFELKSRDITYSDGSLCKPLDVIEVDAVRMCHGVKLNGLHYPDELYYIQPENYLVRSIFRKIRVMDINKLFGAGHEICEEPATIFGNEARYLTPDQAMVNNCSLVMIKTQKVIMYKRNTEDRHFSACFSYNGKEYRNITVTDPDYLPRNDKDTAVLRGDTYIILSLGERYINRYTNEPGHYKLIAKIFNVAYMFDRFYHLYSDCFPMNRYLGSLRESGLPVSLTCGLREKIEAVAQINGVQLCSTCDQRFN